MPSCLVFRDKLLLPSEGFIVANYVGFDALQPVYVANRFQDRADELTGPKIATATASIGRFVFKQTGWTSATAAIQATSPIAVHAHFGRGGAMALPLAERLGLPLFVTFHGGDATKQTHSRARIIPTIYQRRRAALMAGATRFLCVSDFVAGRLHAQGFPAEKLVTHYIGLDLANMAAPSPRDGTFLAVGRLVEKKGFDVLIKAYRQMLQRRPAIAVPHLEIAGSGPEEARLRALAEGIPEIRFLGWQSAADLAAKWASCRAVVVPSKEASNGDCEGLPTVVLEALRAAAPVIASKHAGIPEIIQDGQTGLLVPEGDIAGLSEAMAAMLGRDDGGNALVAAGQIRLRADFDGQQQSRKLQAMLCAAGKTPAPRLAIPV